MAPFQEPPDDDGPISPDELGLPPNYDPKNIPRLSDLQRASVEALDREIAFFLLHRDAPDQIIARLDKIADVVRAASQIKGDHRRRAVRLGLELRHEYWMGANKPKAWMDLIMPMLEVTLELEDQELQSRIYHMWSVYLYVVRDRPSAVEITLEQATAYAEESGRADLKLLAAAERLNAGVLKMELADVRAEADAILTEARQIKYTYAEARAYLLLGRACSSKGLHQEAFSYAQQALILLVSISVWALAGESVILMLGSLSYRSGYSPVYRKLLMCYLETLSRYTANPILTAGQAYFQSVQYYHLEEYDKARECVLLARQRYVMAHYRPSAKRCTHMLGLIQTKRQCWTLAEWHLNAAYAYYVDAGEKTNAAQAQYALASIPFEQKEWAAARPPLVGALAVAQSLAEGTARERLITQIQEDLAVVEEHLAG